MEATIIVFSQKILEDVKKWSASCYPYEGCGLLLGILNGEQQKHIRRFVPLANLLRDRGKVHPAGALDTAADTLGRRVQSQGQFEFVMDPQEFHRTSLEAEKGGLDVLGILHTHPDHPARPSATDAAQPLLAGWSNIIVKVDKGQFVEARSWIRDEETQPFREEEIIIR